MIHVVLNITNSSQKYEKNVVIVQMVAFDCDFAGGILSDPIDAALLLSWKCSRFCCSYSFLIDLCELICYSRLKSATLRHKQSMTDFNRIKTVFCNTKWNEKNMRYTIEELRHVPEGLTFDCKRIHIDPKDPV